MRPQICDLIKADPLALCRSKVSQPSPVFVFFSVFLPLEVTRTCKVQTCKKLTCCLVQAQLLMLQIPSNNSIICAATAACGASLLLCGGRSLSICTPERHWKRSRSHPQGRFYASPRRNSLREIIESVRLETA